MSTESNVPITNDELDIVLHKVSFASQMIVNLQARVTPWFLPSASVHTSEISITWDELNSLKQKLASYHEEFYTVTNAEERATHGPTFATVNAALYSLQVKVGEVHRKRLEVIKTSTEVRSKSTPFKLEKIRLPQFNGKFSEWQNFQDLSPPPLTTTPI